MERKRLPTWHGQWVNPSADKSNLSTARVGPIDEWHVDPKKSSQWRSWVATPLALNQEESQIYVPFVCRTEACKTAKAPCRKPDGVATVYPELALSLKGCEIQ
jgi:hypothetical protein